MHEEQRGGARIKSRGEQGQHASTSSVVNQELLPEKLGYRILHFSFASFSPGQVLQQSLQLVAYQFDQAAFNVAVGDVDHEDVGGRVWRLVVL